MKKSMIWTDIRRDIWQTKNRFFSIVAIVALGTGFFAGIKVTTPNMLLTADEYYQNTQLSDFHLVSTLGLTKDDIEALQKLSEVKSVMPGYSVDLIVDVGHDTQKIMKVISLPTNQLSSDPNYMNQPVLVEGKMPYRSGECLLDANVSDFKIGNSIKFVSDGESSDLSDMLKRNECVVVGRVNSSRYVSFDRGSTTIGNGIIRGFIYLPEEDFSYDVYTDAYLTLNTNASTFSTPYDDAVGRMATQLKSIGDRQEQLRYDDIYQTAMEEIQDGEKEFLDAEAEANKELRDAYRKLTNGQQELLDARKTLAEETKKAEAELLDGEKELQDGEATYQKEYDDFIKKINDAQKKIDDGWVEIEQGENKLANGRAKLLEGQQTLNAEKSAATVQLQQAHTQVNQLKELVTVIKGVNISTIEGKKTLSDLTNTALGLQAQSDTKQLGDVLLLLISSPTTINQDNAIYAFNSAVTAGQKQIDDGYAALDAGQAKLNDASYDIRQGERELDQARIDLEAAQQTLLEEKAKALSEFQDARQELDDAAKKIEDGKKELADKIAEAEIEIDDAQRDLESGWRDYNKARIEASTKLNDARIEIDDAYKEVAKLEYPKWYVFDRNDQVGYQSYEEDAKRVDAIAGVFPIFFIAIAILICFSTMSRMVEEQRVQIGTWKALGYSSMAIMMKYILYALLASVMGSVIGLSIGLIGFPLIIFDAFKIMYIMPTIKTPFDVPMVVVSTVVAVLSTTVAAALASRYELSIAPSQLMRPKPPKKGKRVLLETIPWLWSRFSFHVKITIRNLSRYKGRVAMTMLGIGGCTALMLTGFGLQHSISSIVDKQYGSVFHYDVIGAIDDNATSTEVAQLDQTLKQHSTVSEKIHIYQKSVHVLANELEYSANLFVPETVDQIASFISFQTRVKQIPLSLRDDGVLISEKLARLLDVSIGDQIQIDQDDRKVNVTVTGITENYVLHFVYMTPALYEAVFHESYSSNMVIANLAQEDEAAESAFAVELLNQNAILGVSFTREVGQKFADLIGALNLIVVVLIVCAGALAFVVLYNLTNINVNERLRELATIKVLGFYDVEVSSYIYRENTISAFLGMLLGLVMGILLHRFVIVNAEVEMVMFNPVINNSSYWYSGVLTMLFTVIVNIALHYRLKRIDMVESLKSVE